MAADIRMLTSFVPRRVIEHFAADPTRRPSPRRERYAAALLAADISGFTPIAERLTEIGPEGVERLSAMLNGYFGRVVDVIRRRGGDIVSFTGDGMLVQWPAEPADLAGATQIAVGCAAELASALGVHVTGDEATLTLRLAVGAGEIFAFHAGGIGDRWSFFLAGPALAQALGALEAARPGAPGASPEARALADAAGREPRRHASASPEPAPTPVDSALAGLLGGYAAPVVRSRLAAGQQDWLADLRRVSILFVNVRDLDLAAGDAVPAVQEMVEAVQRALAELEGAFQQLVVDDKGTVVVAAFGLPPLSHEDDGARAALAALQIRDALAGLGLHFGIGLTRGRTLCGPVGNTERREYAMIGDAVNLCARLMAAAGPGEILCDRATVEAAGDAIAFEALEAMPVKGKRGVVDVYRPTARRTSAAGAAARGDTALLVGREAERLVLARRLDRLVTEQAGGSVAIEGEAGLGKSRLIDRFCDDARARDLRVLVAEADAVEQGTAYYAWRAVFATLLRDDASADRARRRRAIQDQLADRPALHRLAPLVNAVVPVDLPENAITAQMTGEVRADNTRELLLALLSDALDEGSAVVVVEDLHWLDSASAALLREMLQRLPSLLVVATTRPPSSVDPSGGLEGLLDDAGFERLPLRPLDLDETAELIRARLGIRELPRVIAERVHAKAGGNPFFSEELVLAMRDCGVVAVENGCAIWHERDDELLPDTLQGVVTSRIDRLEASEQLTMKVASVLGRIFGFGMLRDVHPLQLEERGLRRDLDTLERVDITRLLRPEPELEWIFKHVVTQEAAYALVPFGQRRALHHTVATWIETQRAEDLSPFVPLLAHHWLRAEHYDRAVEYLERAGEEALRSGAYREAIRFLGQAAALVDRGDARVSDVRRIRWERHRGDAFLRLASPAESRPHLERALADLGGRAPEGALAIAAQLAREVAVQVAHRAWPRRFVGTARDRERTTEEAFANEHLGHVCFFTDVMFQGVATILRGLNLAERLGPSAQLARSYALTGTSAGIQGLAGLARRYVALARETLPAVEGLADRALVHVYFVLHEQGLAHWSEAQRLAEEGIAMAERIGDRRRWRDHHVLLAAARKSAGDWTGADEALARLRETLQHEDDALLTSWTFTLSGEVAGFRGDLDESLAHLAQARAAVESCGASEKIWVFGALARTYHRRGDRASALESARTALAWSRRTLPMRVAALEGYAGAAEVLVAALDGKGSRAERRATARDARRALAALGTFCRGFVSGRPRLLLLRGCHEAARGRLARARACWRRSAALAVEHAMPYDEALAHLELGLALERGDPERAALLEAALDLAERLGAAPEVARAREALAS